MTASTAHVEKGQALGGVYTWKVHCGRARRTRDAWSTPRTISAARTSTIPEGSTTIPSAGPPWRPRVCNATSLGLYGRFGRRFPGCSRCRARSHPESGPAPSRGAGRRVRLRAPPRAALHHRGQVGGVAWGTSLLRCGGPVSTRGRGRARCPPAAQVPLGVLPAGGSGTISRSESVPASSCGGSPWPPLSPSALMTSCAASSVGDQGRVLRGAAGSAIVVSLCLRAGGGLRFSHGCSACRRSRVRVGIRCSPCRPRSTSDPIARGIRGQALSSLRLPSFGAGVRQTLLSSVRVWGPSTVPLACMPCGGCVPRGSWGTVPGGDGLPPL